MKEKKLSAVRTGNKTFIATNSKGAKLEMGLGEGQWSPGELVQIALLGCKMFVSDTECTKHGADNDLVIAGEVKGNYDKSEDRFTQITVDLHIDSKQKVAFSSIADAIRNRCTVAHTLENPVSITLNLDVK